MIDEVSASLHGLVGAQSWQSADGRLVNASNYWRDEESLKAFAAAPKHLDAKRQFRKWYGGYHVVISNESGASVWRWVV